jgi:dTDP-4-amino-4,6-dideoxygalactose transaminase
MQLLSKLCVSDLAIFGGSPVFDQPICTGTPNIPDISRFWERANLVLSRRQLSNGGPFVRELEANLATLLGVKHCIATCNGTVALEIAIRALGLQGEVIVPSFTFIATAHALQWLGITPVFADVDRTTHNLDPKHVATMITPRTTGIVGVHLWGRPCDVDQLTQLAQFHDISVLFDAAHAFACSHNGRMIGNFGNLEVFSFHATKFFHTFEGGAVATADDILADKLRSLRNFGFSSEGTVLSVGTNGKMNEVCAAMGLTCLDDIDGFVASNYQNYKQYQGGIQSLAGIRMVHFDERERCNYQYIVIEIDEQITAIDRDLLLLILECEHVVAKRYFYPGCHRATPYRSTSIAHNVLPQTDILAKRALVLPNGIAIRRDHIDRICDIIRFSILHAKEIHTRLPFCIPYSRRYEGKSRNSDTPQCQ